MLILAILISAVLSYLLGSFNSSILVVRLLKHQDIREFGSHNAGLTNTLRCFGKGCAALTLVGDLAKGIVAVLLSKGICELLGTGLTAQNDVHFIGYIAGIFAILGHVFPIYYHFKGGKGVAASVGLVIAFDWRIFVICAIVFFGLFFLTHYVSLCSVSAYLTAFISMIVFGQMGSYHMDHAHTAELYVVMGALTVLAFYRHKKNIKRLLDGTESKIYLSKKNK